MTVAVDAVLRQLGEVVDCEVRELHPETGVIKVTHEPVSQCIAVFFDVLHNSFVWC